MKAKISVAFVLLSGMLTAGASRLDPPVSSMELSEGYLTKLQSPYPQHRVSWEDFFGVDPAAGGPDLVVDLRRADERSEYTESQADYERPGHGDTVLIR